MAPYYEAYQQRYNAIAAAGIELWGHFEAELQDVLARWVDKNVLSGRRVVEFACGEGSGGVVLAQLGCEYLGADVAPYAVEKSRERLSGFTNARVQCLDLVREAPDGEFDAALDISGLHMLITDAHRLAYLKNMHKCLKKGAPVLLYCEAYRVDFPDCQIESVEMWAKISGMDFTSPQRRQVRGKEVMLPTLPARPMSRQGYAAELWAAGFAMEDFIPMNAHNGEHFAAEIQARCM